MSNKSNYLPTLNPMSKILFPGYSRHKTLSPKSQIVSIGYTQVIHFDAILDQIELVDTLPYIQNKAGNQFQINTKTEMILQQIHGSHLN